MSQPDTEQPNREQIEAWSGSIGERWVAEQTALDLAMRPLGEAALDAARVVPGERVLDVGCGCGDSTLALAERVGPRGHVLGVDVSAPMLARAQARVGAGAPGGARRHAPRHAPIELREADASVASFPMVDLLFSRFGLMFFADPAAAFAHLKSAIRDRLAFVCWRARSENEWAWRPTQAIAPHLAPEPAADPLAPGPFAFADRERVHRLLTHAGLRDVRIEPLDRELRWTDSPDLEVATRFFTSIGTAARRLADADPAARARAIDALRTCLAPRQHETGLTLGAAVWIVTARA